MPTATEQNIHVLKRTAPCFWVEYVDNRDAEEIYRHEEEIDFRPQVSNAYRPDLGSHNGSDRSARRGKAESTCPNSGGEYL